MKRNVLEVLPLQVYPFEKYALLKKITGDEPAEILIQAYCLGVIDGKRTERSRRKGRGAV